ncbi:MFS transporter [Nonomuraea sp. KM90]|uniref:MFS transporter n=1 Tax=Nonomuraea sp. KM90 TaxID=3457428 RepID=UPI003FCE4122
MGTGTGMGAARTFLLWTFLRAMSHRGYVLASSLYFVVVARLSAGELILLGTVVAATMLVSDIPAGAWSDTVSRRWSLVAGHGLLAAGMVMTGFVTAFPWIVVTQVLWGLGWALSAGADVAWLTDELTGPDRAAGRPAGDPARRPAGRPAGDPAGPDGIARVLAAAARWELAGGAAGMVVFGVLGWAAGLWVAIVVSGAGVALAGLYVAARFTERGFTPVTHRRRAASLSTLRRGLALARRDREIRLVLAATVIVNGATMITWIFPRQLVALGFPAGDPTLWYTGLGILASLAGVVALRAVEGRIGGAGVVRRAYALACLAGVLGLLVLAWAPVALLGGLGMLLVTGICDPLTRVASVVWVNRRTTSDVRATVQSFLSQAETGGEIVGGLALAALAQSAGPVTALLAAGLLIACAGAVIGPRASRRPSTPDGLG